MQTIPNAQCLLLVAYYPPFLKHFPPHFTHIKYVYSSKPMHSDIQQRTLTAPSWAA